MHMISQDFSSFVQKIYDWIPLVLWVINHRSIEQHKNSADIQKFRRTTFAKVWAKTFAQ